MHARAIPTLLLTSLLAGGLSARQEPGQDPLAAEMTALLLEQVKGDAAAAEAEVGRALAHAAAKDRPRLLLRRVLLLEKLGRAAEVQAALAKLAQEPAPFGPWAAARLGGTAPSSQTTDPAAPLVKLVSQLDSKEGNSPLNNARDELTRLGPLAVPTLLQQLDRLGLYGLRNALALLCQYPDLGVVPALERLLADQDPVRQLTAAQALVQLPLAARKPLATRLLDGTENTWLRLAALEALAEDPAERVRLGAECARLAGSSDTRAQARLAAILAHSPLPGNADVLRLLQPLALDHDPNVGYSALSALPVNLRDDQEPVLLEVLDRLPDAERSHGLFEALARRTGPVWKHVRVRELELRSHGVADMTKALRTDGIEPTGEELVRLLDVSRPEVRKYALSALTRQHDTAGVVKAVRLLTTAEDAGPALHYLIAVAPQEVDAHIATLLEGTQYLSPLLRFARDRGVRAAVPPVLKLLVSGQMPQFAWGDALELIAKHSGPEHLQGVLELGRSEQHTHVTAASTALARWFTPACVGPAMAKLSELQQKAQAVVLDATWRLAAAADVPAIAAALDAAIALDAGRGDRNVNVERMIHTLGRIGGPAVPVLVSLLRHPHSPVQTQAWSALRDNPALDRKATLADLLESADAARILHVLLAEPVVVQDEALRRAAIDGIRTAGNLQNSDGLQQFLRNLPAESRLTLCTEILAPDAPPNLARLAFSALTALGAARDEAYLPLLANGLRNADWEVRHCAIRQIGNTFSVTALPYLLEGMKDEHPDNAALAIKYTERIDTYLQRKKAIEGQLERAGK